MKKIKESAKLSKTKGVADNIDKHVGDRLRIRRSLLGISQDKLAEAAGVTFQQIQKYERGANRISASRLLTFSKLLEVPIVYFYEGLDNIKENIGFSDNNQDEYEADNKNTNMNSLLSRKETIELLKVYYSVPDPKVRKDMVKFMKSMAKKIK